jgi:hypothetical protein
MSAKQPAKKEQSSGDVADEEEDVKYPRDVHAHEEEDAKDVEDDEEENELDDDDEEEEEEDEEEDVVCSLWRLGMHDTFVNILSILGESSSKASEARCQSLHRRRGWCR